MGLEQKHNPEQGPPPSAREGHEPYQTNVIAVLMLGGALAAAVVLTLIVGYWLYFWMLRYDVARDAPPPPVAEERQPPPQPRLQVSPRADMGELQAVEQAVLNNYGWIDRDVGIVRVPVSRAMELIVQQQQLRPEVPEAQPGG
jgi:hypothetical protein